MKSLLLCFILVFLSTILFSDKFTDSSKVPAANIISELESSGTSNNSDYEFNVHASPHEAREMVIQAVEYVKKHGIEKASERFLDSESEFFNLDLYVFVIDMKGNIVCHGRDKGLIGKNQYYLKDSVGKYFIQDFIKLMESKEEGWIKYYWRNYETFDIEEKITYLKKIDTDSFIGCGAYKRKK